MQALKLDAVSGWRWVGAGWRLFRAQPFSFAALLFFSWVLLLIGSAVVGWLAQGIGTLLPFVPVDFVAWVGGLLVAMFTPVLTVGFQQGCRVAASGLPVHPALLFAPFRAGRTTLLRLLTLGAIQMVLLASIVLVTSGPDAFRADPEPPATAVAPAAAPSPNGAGALAPAAQPTEAEQQELLRGAAKRLELGLFCLPVALLMWYAPLLVAWHGLTPGKAMFFSLVAVWRNRAGFIVYGMAWLAICLLISLGIMSALLAMGSFGAIIAAPAVMLLTTCMYCSVYPTYASVFVDPATPPVD